MNEPKKPDSESNDVEQTNADHHSPRVPEYKPPEESATPEAPKAEPPPKKPVKLELDQDPEDDPYMQNMLMSAEELETQHGPQEPLDENPQVAIMQVKLAEKQREIYDLENNLKAVQAQVDEAKDQALRGLAEAENARKRALKEREDAMKYGVAGFAKEMLDLADNLHRAIEAFPQEFLTADPGLKSFYEGIEAIERAMLKSFELQGVKKIEPLDELFNPNFHEVMFETEMPGKRGGTIIQVIEPGYILKDRLLRPARVGIAKEVDPPQDGEGENGSSSSPMSPGGQIDTEA